MGSRRRGRIVSSLAVIVGVVLGDALMVGVAAAARLVSDVEIVHWLIATPIVAVGGYYLFGLTQIRAWEAGTAPMPDHDVRSVWASRRLATGGAVGFVAASLVGGAVAAGWYFGRIHHPRARQLTWLAAWILAVFWCAVYVGLLSWIF